MSLAVKGIGVLLLIRLAGDPTQEFLEDTRVIKDELYDIASTVSNVVLSGLLAARIWWIRNHSEATVREQSGGALGTGVAVLLESAAAYPLIKILTVVYNRGLFRGAFMGKSPFLVTTVPVQVAAISSVLLVNRVARRRSVDQVVEDACSGHKDTAVPLTVTGGPTLVPFNVPVPPPRPPKGAEPRDSNGDDPGSQMRHSIETSSLEGNPPSYITVPQIPLFTSHTST
ncbi:hypothetical protein PM082_004066 [Marasmius tenuissimus]|nr:hypothetical protein PM082_004066 [Marasmius tenuissimus]